MTKFKLGLSTAVVAIIGAATASAGQYYAGTYAPLRTTPAFAQNHMQMQVSPQLRQKSQPTCCSMTRNSYPTYGPNMGETTQSSNYQAPVYAAASTAPVVYANTQGSQPVYVQPYRTSMQASPTTRSKFGIGGHLSSVGYGIEVKAKVGSKLVTRLGYNALRYEIDESLDGIDYTGDVEMNTFSPMLDLHPFENGFHLTGGAFFGDKTFDLVATPTSNVQVGGVTVTPGQVGQLDTHVGFDDAAPYLGLGYDNFAYSNKPLTFNIRAGVMFTGEPDVTLESSGGTLSADPLFIDELVQEEQNLRDELSDLDIWPVVSVGATYRF